jgi:anti-anti-sigma factor
VDCRLARRARHRHGGSVGRPLGEIFAQGTKIVVDLSDADFIDSSTIRVILRAYQHAEETHGDKVVLVVPPVNLALQRLLEVSGLRQMLPVFPDRQRALSALT